MVSVRVEMPPGELRTSVESALLHYKDVAILDSCQGPAPEVVVTTARYCPPARCAELRRDGTRVIVLASFPNEAEHAAYAAAGADRYLAMGSESIAIGGVVAQVLVGSRDHHDGAGPAGGSAVRD
jgi:hypothetical protein